MNEKLYITAVFELIDGYREELLNGFKELAEASRAEPGNDYYLLTLDETDPNRCVVLECWKSEAAFKEHVAAPHFKKFQKFSEGKRKPGAISKLKRII